MTHLHTTWRPDRPGPLETRRPGPPLRPGLGPAPIWFGLTVVVCALVLLTAFRQVVQQGMQQADSRHRAAAAHASGFWQCNAVRAAAPRELCRAQNDAAYAAAAAPIDRPGAATTVVANSPR